nr:signal recognition particle-docking protein FtsY [Nakamurella lactea]
MPNWIWILIVVVVVVAALFVVGLMRANRRRISLRDTAPTKPAAVDAGKPPAKGGYKAGGSISFSSGSGTAVQDRPPAPAPEPSPEPERTEPSPQAEPSPGAESSAAVEPAVEPAAESRPAEDAVPGAQSGSVAQATPVEDAAAVPTEEALPAVTGPAVETTPAPTTAAPSTAESSPAESTTAESTTAESSTAESSTAESSTAESSTPESTTAAPATVQATGVEPSPDTEIAPTDGRLNRLRGRLSRSQNAFGRSMLGLLGAGTMDEDSWTDVEDTLLLADLGAQASAEIAEKLRAEVAANGIGSSAEARALLRRVLVEAVDPSMERSVRALPHDGRPSVSLVVGVNGTGKTTTTGKLARVLVADGHKVVLGAADTFRAAAADQLATWAERAGATVVRADAGADPASVAFDAVKTGIATGADAVLIDTAGRLHTKAGLMDELGKVKRVVEKQAEVDEVLLVLDATTGQNGLVQARVFAEVVNITGIVLTKLDGTAKGGIVVAVQRALGVPVKLVGLGEGPDDLAPFEAGAFVDALLGD